MFSELTVAILSSLTHLVTCPTYMKAGLPKPMSWMALMRASGLRLAVRMSSCPLEVKR